MFEFLNVIRKKILFVFHFHNIVEIIIIIIIIIIIQVVACGPHAAQKQPLSGPARKAERKQE